MKTNYSKGTSWYDVENLLCKFSTCYALEKSDQELERILPWFYEHVKCFKCKYHTYGHPEPISAVKSAENVSIQFKQPVLSKKRHRRVQYVNYWICMASPSWPLWPCCSPDPVVVLFSQNVKPFLKFTVMVIYFNFGIDNRTSTCVLDFWFVVYLWSLFI
jgi:hypothetical protein